MALTICADLRNTNPAMAIITDHRYAGITNNSILLRGIRYTSAWPPSILLKKIKNQMVVIRRVTSPFIAGPAWRAISNAIRKLRKVETPRVKTVLIISRCKRNKFMAAN